MGRQVSKLLKRSKSREADYNTSSKNTDDSLPEGFRWLEGRGYRSDGNPAYALPNDDAESSRLNLQHYIFRAVFNGYFVAPVHEGLQQGIKVLDVGCGTGIWSIEMAQLYANSSFTGTDMINVFAPYVASAPKNCSFVIANTLKGLPFPDDTFDYVFQRMQVGSFRKPEWPEVYAELVRVTKRGGWVELIDTDGRLYNSGPAATAYDEKLHYMFGLRGINMACISHRSRNFEDVGLESVVHKIVSVPVGWGGDIGAAAAKNTITSYTSLRPVMLVALGLGEDEYSAMTREATAELLPGTMYRTYWNAEVAYGRKPELVDKIMIDCL